jgi:hypothetical protein
LDKKCIKGEINIHTTEIPIILGMISISTPMIINASQTVTTTAVPKV